MNVSRSETAWRSWQLQELPFTHREMWITPSEVVEQYRRQAATTVLPELIGGRPKSGM